MPRKRTFAAFLSKEQETELFTRYQATGDERAMQAVIVAHEALVRGMAGKYRGLCDPEELVQEGNIGLLKAAAKFDVNQGVRFSTYAQWWVRAEMQSHVIAHHSVVRGRQVKRRGQRLNPHATISIHRNGYTILDGMPDDSRSPEELTALSVDCSRLSSAMHGLNEREASILRRRFDDETLDAIGTDYGISKERVRQIEQGAVEKLRAAMFPPRTAAGNITADCA